jgi:autotransporter-associated beta strand protein
MKPKTALRSFLALAGSSLLAISSANAASVTWDITPGTVGTGDGAITGGNGIWNTANGNWTTDAGVNNVAWVNTNNDIAVFAGTAGTVTLGEDITIGGLQFNTTAYTLAGNNLLTLNFASGDNTILFNNIAAAGTTISGAAGLKIGGAGNVILTAANPTVVGTLTLGYSAAGDHSTGWSGTTTVNPGMTLLLNGRDLGLSSTSGITLNGGGITLANTNSTQGAFNRVNDTADITSNGGTFTYNNTSGSGLIYAESLDALDLIRGQTNFVFTNNMAGGGGNSQALTLSGLTRTGATNTSVVAFSSTGGLNTTTNRIVVTGAGTTSGWVNAATSNPIIGPWATVFNPTANSADYAVFNSDQVVASGTTHSLESNWTDDTQAYMFNAQTSKSAAVLSATRNITGLNVNTFSSASNSVDPGTETITWTGHALVEGAPLYLSGTVTGGLTSTTTYYVRNVSGDTFQLSLTPTGTIADLTNTTNIAGMSPGMLLSTGNNLGTTGILATTGVTTTIAATGTGVVTLPSTTSDALYVSTVGPGAANINIQAPIANNDTGVLTLVKSGVGGGGVGQGVLTLGGNNTYTGGTVINGGTVAITNANSFGTGPVTVNGNAARINATGAISYSNNISMASGAILGIQNSSASANTATFSGALTGSGTLSLVQGAVTGSTVAFTNTNNTFTGNVILPAAAGTNDFINFASIGDGGSIIFGRASWLANIGYTGAANLTLNTRNIALAATFGNTTGLDGSGNPTHMFANNGAGTVTINTAMGVTSTASSGFFFLGGNNTGNNTFAGAIADPTGTNTLGIGKSGTGKWILSNNTNSYEGNVLIHDGTLSVGVIDVAANSQPLGKGSLIQFGYRTANTGTLEYTGSANAVTNKQIQLGQLPSTNNGNFAGGGVILNNGAGTLTFSNATFNSITGVPGGSTVDRTLTLGGTNTGANTISGTVQDNLAGAAQLLLTKSGAGTWVLEGDNTYTGTTAIQSGLLIAGHANAIGSGAITLNNDAILGLGAGDFTRQPNVGATVSGNRVTFLANGGFAAFGADRIVNFGGASGIVAIGSTATPGVIGDMNGKTFILGHATATHKVTVTNTLDFGNASRTIQVNNGAAAIDAEISGVIQPQAAGTAGFTKTGAGTLLLSNSNTYNGSTTINGGTLIITGATQATSAITFGGGTLGLNIASSVTAANASIDFTGQQVLVTGTPTLPSYTLLTASSMLGEPTLASPISGYELDVDGNQLKLISTATDPYEDWADGALFDEDENGDGVSNGLAFLLGAADPDANALGLLPTVTENAGGLVLDFSMLNAAARGTATLFIEHSSDLGITDAWEEIEVPLVDGTVTDVVFDIEGTGPLDVEATIPVGKAQAGKLFGRLKAVKP